MMKMPKNMRWKDYFACSIVSWFAMAALVALINYSTGFSILSSFGPFNRIAALALIVAPILISSKIAFGFTKKDALGLAATFAIVETGLVLLMKFTFEMTGYMFLTGGYLVELFVNMLIGCVVYYALLWLLLGKDSKK